MCSCQRLNLAHKSPFQIGRQEKTACIWNEILQPTSPQLEKSKLNFAFFTFSLYLNTSIGTCTCLGGVSLADSTAMCFCLPSEQATAQAAGICSSGLGLLFLISQFNEMSSRETSSSWPFFLITNSAKYAMFQKYVTNITPLHPNSDKAQGQHWQG